LTPGTVVLSRPTALLRPPPAALQRPVPIPPVLLPSPGAASNEASQRIHLRSPVRPSPACGARMDRALLGFCAPSFTPHRYRRRMSGWGQALSTCLGLRRRHHSSTLLSASPLTACDLVSHRARILFPGSRSPGGPWPISPRPVQLADGSGPTRPLLGLADPCGAWQQVQPALRHLGLGATRQGGSNTGPRGEVTLLCLHPRRTGHTFPRKPACRQR